MILGVSESQDGYFATTGAQYEYFQANHQLNFGYCIFTASGNLTVLRKRPIPNCSILVVGGGGSGGGNQTSASGGGGGAGGWVVLTNNITLFPKTTYTVTVGSGGAGSLSAGNKGGTSSWNGQINAQGGNGGGAAFSTGIYANQQFPGSGAGGGNGGGAGGGGGHHWNITNGRFGQTGSRHETMTYPANGEIVVPEQTLPGYIGIDKPVERIVGYFGTGGGGGEFGNRFDGIVGYAGGTNPWFVDPRYVFSSEYAYLGAGQGKLLTTPEGDSPYFNYFVYGSNIWPSFIGDPEARIFTAGNGGPGAPGAYTSNVQSSGAQNGIVILRYRL